MPGKHEKHGKPTAGAGSKKPQRKDIAVRYPNGVEIPRQTKAFWKRWFERAR